MRGLVVILGCVLFIPAPAGEVALSPSVVLVLPEGLDAELYPGYGDALAIVELSYAETGKPFASGAVEAGPDYEVAPNAADLAVLLTERFPSLKPESLVDARTGGEGGRFFRLEVYPKGGFYTCRVVGVYSTSAGCFVVDFAATAPRSEAVEALCALDFRPSG
ncbi:MAG: hypothetical protein A2Y64_07590 [Candidatus Coatesbacteria bacterium RBG_13_66_14]|uniref:PsbP C-terminal domain-containing protein n=1 Tax=Candidatus Coatesbacteria bacterium RBG_13_66_14 TaxID=1817816 RepID=A0A1F5EWD7_9BACT|nr:MAG: hypothetical protein A2Y64_07590 [Candidatus Coatesbacteria bacterium RBG_13_66_14]